jgi:hypothetical protein
MIGKCLDAIALKRSDKNAPNWVQALAPYEKQYGKLFKQDPENYGDVIGDVKQIISRYERYYADDGLTYLKGLDGKPYEIEVKVDLAPGILFTGHIDKMPRDKQGRIWIMDHKSHKVLPDADNRFSDLQLILYFWAAPLSNLGKPTGVLWDYLRTKLPAVPEQLKDGTLSKRKNIDTTYDTYLAEVKRLKLREKDYADILSQLKPRGEIDFLLRVPLPAPRPEMVKTIAQDALSTAKEIQRNGDSTVRTMDRTCKQCEFFELCQAEVRGLDSNFIRKTQYQINPEPKHDHRHEDSE